MGCFKSKEAKEPVTIQKKPQELPKQDAPEILVGNYQPPQNQIDLNSLPDFYIETFIAGGFWKFYFESSEIEFEQATQYTIEKDFLLGKADSKFEMNMQETQVNFASSTMKMKSSTPIGPNSETEYKVLRETIEPVKYWWEADDGTSRPLPKEIEVILAETEGVLAYKLNEVPFQVNLKKQALTELGKGLVHQITIIK